MTDSFPPSSGRDLPDARSGGGSGGDPILGAALEGLRRAVEEVEVERSTAETLQRSLLRERLPDVAGVRLSARYLPGSGEARIGGDWYDAIPLRDGRIALVIGDVVGRGVEAAARMAHLQSAVRAYALEALDPAAVLSRMNGFAHELERRGTATLLFCVVDPATETVRLASAGHPPPLLIAPNAAPRFVEGPAGSPLGASMFPKYEELEISMPAGSVLILYTDGLIERPDQSLDTGMEVLAVGIGELPDRPDEICHTVLDLVLGGGGSPDDVAILVARLDEPAEVLDLTVPAEPAALAMVRTELERWLRAQGVDSNAATEIQIACGEACANAIAHAYPPGDAHFAVRASIDGDHDLAIEIADYGAWRTPRGGTGGRGLALIEQLTDSLDIDRGMSGTTVRMRRRVAQEAR